MKTRKKIYIAEDIIPLSEFKIHASKVLNSIRETGRAVVITQNGKPAGVLISAEEFDRMREREEFVSAVEQGREDAEAGRVEPTTKIEKELDRRYGKL